MRYLSNHSHCHHHRHPSYRWKHSRSVRLPWGSRHTFVWVVQLNTVPLHTYNRSPANGPNPVILVFVVASKHIIGNIGCCHFKTVSTGGVEGYIHKTNGVGALAILSNSISNEYRRFVFSSALFTVKQLLKSIIPWGFSCEWISIQRGVEEVYG